MKNYYDELEVSRNASKEVINKAYKVLAKKYHPDTTKENKEISEERFKKISIAYETLCDETKKRIYDEELNKTNPQISIEEYDKLLKENQILQNELVKLKNKFNTINQTSNNHIRNKNNINKQTTNSNNGQETNNYTKTSNSSSKYSFFNLIHIKLDDFFKNIVAILLTIIFIFSVLSILLYIPYTRNLLLNDMGFEIFFKFFD